MRNTRQHSIRKEILNLRRSFVNIARAFERIEPALTAATAPAPAGKGAAAKSTRRRPRLTTTQRRALKLQGRYMGTMRGLSARKQAKVKAIRKAKGIHAAIAEAKRLAAR